MPNYRLNILRILTFIFLSVCSFSFAFAAKEKQFVVVVDAGHGGKDTGAFENNLKEKDVTLAVAQKLADLLKKKGIKVIMTRDADKYVSLTDRTSKANKAKADLFISIHVNSLSSDIPNRKNIEGAQVFILGNHESDETLAVAMRENAVIVEEKDHQQRYNGFNPNKKEDYESFDYDNEDTESRSIGIAQEVYKELIKTAGRRERGVHQAEFLVLRDIEVPAILVEVDYLSNPASANYIGKSAGQKKLAQSISNAVAAYRNALKKNPQAFDGKSLGTNTGNTDGLYVLVSDNSRSARRTATAVSKTTSKRPNTANCERRRRSSSARIKSENQSYETSHIEIHEESKARVVADIKASTHSVSQSVADNSSKQSKSLKNNKEKKEDKKKPNKQEKKKSSKDDDEQNYRIVNGKKVLVSKQNQLNNPSKSSPRSLKSNKPSTYNEPEPEQARKAVAKSFGKTVASDDETTTEQTTEIDYDDLPAASAASESATARRRVKSDKQITINNQKEENNQKSTQEYSTSSAPKSLKSKKK